MKQRCTFTDEERTSTRWLMILGVMILSGALGYGLGVQRGLELPSVHRVESAAADVTLPYILEEAGRRARSVGDVDAAQWFEGVAEMEQQKRKLEQRRLGARGG
jgi:hypothetical protein